MSEERKIRVWPWITAGILLPVLYIASFGPACWITSQLDPEESAIGTIYWPVLETCWQGEQSWGWILWYAHLGAHSGWAMEYSRSRDEFNWVHAF